jgi:hypothetical protein
MTSHKPKMWKAWAGFADGKLDTWLIDDGWGGLGTNIGLRDSVCLFKTRREARQRFQDVRPVTITLSKPKGRAKK